jgi:hypothetical protein
VCVDVREQSGETKSHTRATFRSLNQPSNQRVGFLQFGDFAENWTPEITSTFLELAVRALGEAWQVGGSRSEFARLIAAFLDAVVDFGLDDEEVEEIVAWVLRLLRQYFDGRRSEWCVVVWEALEASRLGDDLARRAEHEALDEVRAGRMHELEIDMVLARQVRRVTRRLREITEDSVEQGG